MIIHILVMVIVFAISVMVHEVGHYVVARLYGYPAGITTDKRPGRWFPDLVTVWYGMTPPDHEQAILGAGIMLGFLPVFATILWYDQFLVGAWLFFAYFWVCMSDLKKMYHLKEVSE